MITNIVDINVSYGPWPFQSFKDNSLADVYATLGSYQISEAFVSHLGSVFDLDTEKHNRALIEDCSQITQCHPVPTVNPAVPGWQRQLDDLQELTSIQAIRLYPSYHNVSLVSDTVDEVVSYSRSNELKIMIVVRLEDARTRYHGLGVVGVPSEDITAFCERHPEDHPICLNAYLPEIKEIGSSVENASFDTSFADWFFVMEELRSSVGLSRVAYGSHSPFLYTGATIDKIRLSRLTEKEKRQVFSETAGRFFDR